jgi:uncharacterized membrane protein
VKQAKCPATSPIFRQAPPRGPRHWSYPALSPKAKEQNMDKMVVVVFATEPKAYEGLRAFSDLHREGSLTVYSDAVIAKDTAGTVALRQSASIGPVGTLLGGATGTLIGLLGGPAGAAAGMIAGGLGGSAYDVANLGIGADFVNEVSKRLTPGKAAVVAEIEEEWITPLDDHMDRLGGAVYRRSRRDVIDFQDERDAAALQQELERMKQELAQAKGAAKAKINEKMASTQAALKAAEGRAKARVETINKTIDTKIEALKDQASKSTGEAKARLEQQIADIKADRQSRSAKLHQAWQLTKEALTISPRH